MDPAQTPGTSTEEPKTAQAVTSTATEPKTAETVTPTATTETPFKVFNSKEDFDRHSAGILNSAKNKAEKEMLALLGLKPDEKDKLAEFKKAYDATLSEAEKQAKNLANLTSEIEQLKSLIVEKDATIAALSRVTGKKIEDVSKYVKMAKGLVDENTDINQALETVFGYMKAEPGKPAGVHSQPLNQPTNPQPTVEENPFKGDNLTKQGQLIMTDKEKARQMYFAAYGKAPSW